LLFCGECRRGRSSRRWSIGRLLGRCRPRRWRGWCASWSRQNPPGRTVCRGAGCSLQLRRSRARLRDRGGRGSGSRTIRATGVRGHDPRARSLAGGRSIEKIKASRHAIREIHGDLP
jgi:hypothetical protein